MTIYVKDAATDKAVRRLAKLKRKTLTETIREAVDNEYQASKAEAGGKTEMSIREKIDELVERFNKYPRTGLKADKAFFDELSGDL